MENQELIQLFIQLLSMLVALAAVLVGPFVTLHVANLESRVNVLSKNRQEWINTLRLEIVAFMTNMVMIRPLLASSNSGEMYKLLEEGNLHLYRTKLLINPREADHTALIQKMEAIWGHAMALKPIPSDLDAELVAISQKVLKGEWERVKAFK